MSEFVAQIRADLDLSKAKGDMSKFLNQKHKVNVQFDAKGLNGLKTQLDGLSKGQKVKIPFDTSGVKTATKEFQMVKSLVSQINKTKVKVTGLDPTKNANEYKVLQSQIKSMTSDYQKLMSQVGKSFNSVQKNSLKNMFDGVDAKIKDVVNSSKNLDSVLKSTSKSFSQFDAIAASNKTEQFLKTNTKLGKNLRDTFQDIADKQRNAVDSESLAKANKQYRAAISQAKLAGETGKSITSEFGRAFGQIGQFVGIYSVLQKGVDSIGQMARAVLDVDTAMTELRKVSTANDFQIDKYFDKAVISAKKYGATVSNVISSTADWTRLGYGLKEAEKLSDATTMLQRVGDNMTQESSSQGLISILKGFQMESDQAGNIVDKINEVANKEPIDTAGITSALQRSASSLSAAGNTIDESIAMITAANSVVQDPESVGKMLADVA